MTETLLVKRCKAKGLADQKINLNLKPKPERYEETRRYTNNNQPLPKLGVRGVQCSVRIYGGLVNPLWAPFFNQIDERL